MIETYIENGKTYADLASLSIYDKNPRGIYDDDFFRLIKQILRLGPYKPLIVTPDGVTAGGNMRVRGYQYIVKMAPHELQNYFESELGKDRVLYLHHPEENRVKLGEEVTIEECERIIATLKRPWISIVETIDEAAMTEYLVSDNDAAGYWEEQKLAEIVQPHKELIPLPHYKVETMKPMPLPKVLQKFGPGDPPEAKPNRYTVIIEVKNEAEQDNIFQKLAVTGLKVSKRTL